LPLDDQEFTFEAYVLFEHNGLPVAVFNPAVVQLKEMVPQQ